MLRMRPVQFDDYQDVQRVCWRNGLGKPDESTLANSANYKLWRSLWEENPAYPKFADIPKGWILHDDVKGIVGSMSSHFCLYEVDGIELKAISASAWAVDPEFRMASALMVKAFAAQPRIDIFVNTSASPDAGRVFKAFGFQEPHNVDSSKLLFWITDVEGLVKATFAKKGIRLPAFPKRLVGQLVSSFLVMSRQRRREAKSAQIELVQSFDERFDQFWSLLRSQPQVLLAKRDSASLNHHFSLAKKDSTLTVLVSKGKGSISGYVAMMRKDVAQIGLKVQSIVDLQAIDSREDDLRELLEAAIHHAKADRCHVVELHGFNEKKRQLAKSLGAFSRSIPTIPYGVKIADTVKKRIPFFEVEISDFDGDASLGSGFKIMDGIENGSSRLK